MPVAGKLQRAEVLESAGKKGQTHQKLPSSLNCQGQIYCNAKWCANFFRGIFFGSLLSLLQNGK